MNDNQNKPADVKFDARLAAANTKFGFNLFSEIEKQGARPEHFYFAHEHLALSGDGLQRR